jgi:hypothetical protein
MTIRPWTIALGALCWLGALGVGEWLLSAYSTTPGALGDAPATWPVGSRITKAPGRWVLVLFAHPRCPCTRATLGELALLMASCKDRVSAHVCFVKPAGLPEDWEYADLWRSAASIPGVQVWADPGGAEARRFRAATSGLALLYDGDGRLRFRGGITPARGHAGDNTGREALRTLLLEGGPGPTETPVFGCPLFEG